MKVDDTLKVQVPNNHIIFTQDLYCNSCYPDPKYLIIGYLDPLGKGSGVIWIFWNRHVFRTSIRKLGVWFITGLLLRNLN